MSDHLPNFLQTVAILGSRVLVVDGQATALSLETDHLGTIAFEVNLETIAILRTELDRAEAALLQQQQPSKVEGQ